MANEKINDINKDKPYRNNLDRKTLLRVERFFENKYNKALVKAQEVISSTTSHEVKKVIEYIFSEDEEEDLRKEIIQTINLAYDCGVSLTKEQRDKYIAWLEKVKI